MDIPKHEQRIKQELKAAGVSHFGMAKFSIKYLPKVIHENEHVGGVIYGRYKDKSGGSSPLNEGVLVATNFRIIFLDHKPGYTAFDELTYQVVSGLQKSTAAFASTVTLHTRITDYVLRFANPKCADIFIAYVEQQRLERASKEASTILPAASAKEFVVQAKKLDKKAEAFLNGHESAVLSTIDRTGNIHGAVVYYYPSPDGFIYVLTKAETQKAHNIFAHSQVALTIYDEAKLQTAQLQGHVSVEADPATKQHIFDEIVKLRQYGTEKRLPPVTQLQAGAFIVLKIAPTSGTFRDFKQD